MYVVLQFTLDVFFRFLLFFVWVFSSMMFLSIVIIRLRQEDPNKYVPKCCRRRRSESREDQAVAFDGEVVQITPTYVASTDVELQPTVSEEPTVESPEPIIEEVRGLIVRKAEAYLERYRQMMEEASAIPSPTSETESKNCVICYKPKGGIFAFDCQHAVTCLSCAHELITQEHSEDFQPPRCPMCRARITKITKIFE